MEPWNIDPDLTEDRLEVIARAIVDARDSVKETYDPERGDIPWNFGCSAHTRTMHGLRLVADAHPWLTVEGSGLAYRIRIGKVVARVSRGDASNPSQKSLQRGLSDLVSTQGLFEFFEDELELEDAWFWQVTVETHADGTAAQVVFHQATRSGETRSRWAVPAERLVRVIAEVVPFGPDAVEFPPADVHFRAHRMEGVDAHESEPEPGGRAESEGDKARASEG
jgi:hypothetical protein